MSTSLSEAHPRRWSELASTVIGKVLADDPRHVCLLPVGATEQHGPHLPAGTDTIVASAVADEVSRATGAIVLPALSFGASFYHGTSLPGTLSAEPQELITQVRRTAEWARYSGVRRMLIVNGHVGNVAPLTVAVDYLRFERPDVRIGVIPWWQADPWVAEQVTADCADWHANCAETSVMLAIAPSLVCRDAALTADDQDRTPGLIFRYTVGALSTNGVTGRPSQATAELGRELLTRVTGSIVRTVEQARAEEPPLLTPPSDPQTAT